jgi:hypothetical protein
MLNGQNCNYTALYSTQVLVIVELIHQYEYIKKCDILWCLEVIFRLRGVPVTKWLQGPEEEQCDPAAALFRILHRRILETTSIVTYEVAAGACGTIAVTEHDTMKYAS